MKSLALFYSKQAHQPTNRHPCPLTAGAWAPLLGPLVVSVLRSHTGSFNRTRIQELQLVSTVTGVEMAGIGQGSLHCSHTVKATLFLPIAHGVGCNELIKNV